MMKFSILVYGCEIEIHLLWEKNRVEKLNLQNQSRYN